MIALTSIGLKFSYAMESTVGTRPTTNFKHVKGLFSTPDFNIAPSTADVSTFENEEFSTKIALLKELPDTLDFGYRLSQEFIDSWETLVEEYKTAREDGLSAWFCIEAKGLEKALYFRGEPSGLGLPPAEVNSGIDGTAFIVPTGEPKWDAKPEVDVEPEE